MVLISNTNSAVASAARPLASLGPGSVGVVREVGLEGEDAKLLCAMGMCIGARVKLVRTGEPCVVAVGGVDSHRCRCGGRCRIGLARRLAERVFVEPIDKLEAGT